jgi:hypothetical protein
MNMSSKFQLSSFKSAGCLGIAIAAAAVLVAVVAFLLGSGLANHLH